MGGRITVMAFTCITALYPVGKHNFSITQMTTNPCPVISRAWHKSFVNTTCGQRGGLLAQCPDFKCPPNCIDCCCHCILYLQPDFISQKSQLKEAIEQCGHICDFYPKYHCELNFIEQYWGKAKSQYRVTPRAKTGCEMESTVRESLDSVSLLQIRWSALFFCVSSCSPLHRFTNRATRFINAYGEGLTGAQAAWENKKYHGHCTLPPASILEAKHAIE